MFGWFKNRRRKRLRALPFPDAWLGFIQKNVPIYNRFPQADQNELQGHIQVFLSEKYFEGCGGLALTDEIKVTIAAQACLLLLHRETDYYPRLVTILVYPSAYVARHLGWKGGGIMEEGEMVRLGEAWMGGVAVLSWDDVSRRTSEVNSGLNVALHEFAHLLDFEDGSANGTPSLEHSSHYRTWARVLSDEYEKLRRDTALGRTHLLDSYGATNPAEFFAVATECFFEKPIQLRRKHPALYEELKTYFRQDPAELDLPSLTASGASGQDQSHSAAFS
jgi:Mlc titration factor MtfA (ptsG expression regulator)